MPLIAKQSKVSLLIGLLACLLLVKTGFGQTLAPTSPDGSASSSTIQAPTSLVQAFWTEQLTLRQSITTLLAQGDTPDQMDAWTEQNFSLFQAQMQQAQLLAAYEDFQPMSYVTGVTIPDDASSTMENFLVGNANLFNSLAQIHNQLVQAGGQTISAQGDTSLRESEDQLFVQQNAAALQTQSVQATSLAQAAAHQPMPVPPPLVVPVDATPQMRAFLIARDQLMRGEVAVHNQYCAGSLTQLHAALEQFEQGNAAQITLLAQPLAPSTPNP